MFLSVQAFVTARARRSDDDLTEHVAEVEGVQQPVAAGGQVALGTADESDRICLF